MSEFWLGVLITLIVGIPGAYAMALLANMHTPRLAQYLQSRKLLKTHKTKQQALRVFNRIKAFHDGTSDRYAFYILLTGSAIVCTIVASTLVLSVVFQNEFPIHYSFGILILFAALTFLIALLLLSSIYETSRQLERFDDYKAEFEQRWGAIDPKT